MQSHQHRRWTRRLQCFFPLTRPGTSPLVMRWRCRRSIYHHISLLKRASKSAYHLLVLSDGLRCRKVYRRLGRKALAAQWLNTAAAVRTRPTMGRPFDPPAASPYRIHGALSFFDLLFFLVFSLISSLSHVLFSRNFSSPFSTSPFFPFPLLSSHLLLDQPLVRSSPPPLSASLLSPPSASCPLLPSSRSSLLPQRALCMRAQAATRRSS